MIRKTFATKPEATKYQNEMTDNGHIAVLGALGDKFRVYVETKEETERMASWRRDNWDKGATERYLRKIAWAEGDTVESALTIQKAMADNSVYNDYDNTLQVARIMAEVGELKSASDVFHFIDNTHQYDKAMKQFIDETLADCDYEGKEEVKAE